MSNVFGKKVTKTNNSVTLQDSLLALSDSAMRVLVRVLDQLDDNSFLDQETLAKTDTRGVYIEHDNYECKPFSTKAVKELLKSGLVQKHAESNDGVSFITVNSDVMFATIEIGEFNLIDPRP